MHEYRPLVPSLCSHVRDRLWCPGAEAASSCVDDKGKEHVKNQERRRAEGEAAAGDQDFRGVPRVATLKLNYHENLSPDPNGHTLGYQRTYPGRTYPLFCVGEVSTKYYVIH